MKTLAQAKYDFSIGYLTTFKIERGLMGEGWLLHLGEGNSAGFLVDARTKKARIFKSVDSVISTLESIGFEILLLRR